MMDAGFLLSVIERAGAAIVACDREGRVVLTNAAARELLPGGGVPPGHPLFRALRGERLTGIDTVDAEPLRDETGQIVGAVATCHAACDRREMVAAVMQILDSTTDLEVSLANLASFLAGQFADECYIDLVNDDGEPRPARSSDAGRESLIVPLAAGTRVLGAITLVGAKASDMTLLEDIAFRTALSIENARLRQLAGEHSRQAEQACKDLRMLLDSTGEGIYGIDPRGRCTFVNGSAAAILGYAREELIGRDMHRLIHYSHANGAPYPAENCPIYRALLEGRGTRVDDEFFYRSDGSAFPVEYSSYPIEEHGAILGLIVTFTDSTARKRAEESLRAAEAKYRGLFEHISEGVYQTSPNGELLAANPALVRMLGYNSELELRALDVNDLYADAEDRRKFAEQLEREGRLSDAPLRLRRKDGRIITVLENARAVRDERTNVLYYEGTLSLSKDSDPAQSR